MRDETNLKAIRSGVVLSIPIVAILLGGVGHPVAAAPLFSDDFEGYSLFVWPAASWVADANATSNSVENRIEWDPTSGSNKVLKLFGAPGACWSALAYAQVSFPAHFVITCDIYNGFGPLGGCHPHRGEIGMRQGTSWANPWRTLLEFMGNGGVQGLNGVTLTNYATGQWYHVQVDYDRQGTDLWCHYWLNGADLGLVHATIEDLTTEMSFDHVQLVAQELSVYFDNLSLIDESDSDGDGLIDSSDNCPTVSNPNQADGDGDGTGDMCDNCPDNANPDQADCNHDGKGDVCAIAETMSQDCNANGVPDECELMGVVADSAVEFAGTQGQNNWYYGYYQVQGDSASWQKMPYYSPSHSWWERGDPEPWGVLFATGGVPGGYCSNGLGPTWWVVRRWRSEISGQVLITGHLSMAYPGLSGTGIEGNILVNGQQIWSQPIAAADFTGVDYQLAVDLQVGWDLDFAISAPEGALKICDDWAYFTAVICHGDCNGNGILDACEADGDHDGVIDAYDACPNTVVGATVDATGCPPLVPGDFDRDGDVDRADLAILQACATGPVIMYDPAALPAPPPGCALAPDACGLVAADFDGDGDVDQYDFGMFQWCYSGVNHPADPNCVAQPAANAPPIAMSQSVAICQDTPVSITLHGADPAQLDLSFIITAMPTHGTLSAVDNAPMDTATVIYYPDVGFTGLDSFNFAADNGALQSPPATVTIEVRSGSLVLDGTAGLAAVGRPGGPFSPAKITYTLSNATTTPLDWRVPADQIPAWLSVSPSSGSLPVGGSALVDVSIVSSIANSLARGVYAATLRFTDDATGKTVDRPVSLNVTAPPTAIAGPDIVADDAGEDGVEQVTLDGSASSADFGRIVSYRWSEGGVVLAESVEPNLQAKSSVTLSAGRHNITLTVTDDANESASDEVEVVVQSRLLTPGSGWTGPTPEPAPVGSLGQAGYDAKAMAHWDVVPYQMFDGEFEVGVLAFHINGIDRVEFSVSGGPWLPVCAMAMNPQVDVLEYWVRLRASDFVDGQVEVRAVAWPKVGVPRVLEPLLLSSNAFHTLPTTVRYVSPMGSDINDGLSPMTPLHTIIWAIWSAADGSGRAEGVTIYLLAGDHVYTGLSSPTVTNSQRWVTITSAPGLERESVRVTGSGTPTVGGLQLVHLRSLTVDAVIGGPVVSSTVDDARVWWDRCDIEGGPDRYDVAGRGVFGDGDAWRGGRYMTDCIVQRVHDGPTSFALVRNCDVEQIAGDAFGCSKCVVNSTISDINPGSSGAQPYIYETQGIQSNTILYGVTTPNWELQQSDGIVASLETDGQPISLNTDFGIVNCSLSASRQVMLLGGHLHHGYIWNSDFRGWAGYNAIPGRFVTTDLVIENTTFRDYATGNVVVPPEIPGALYRY